MNGHTHTQSQAIERSAVYPTSLSVQHRCGHSRRRGTLTSYAVSPMATDEYVSYVRSTLCADCCDWHTNSKANHAFAAGTYFLVDRIEALALGIGSMLVRIGAFARRIAARKPLARDQGRQPVTA
jgi:hypothetical protein